jgi:hypothetical protein
MSNALVDDLGPMRASEGVHKASPPLVVEVPPSHVVAAKIP